MAQEVANTNTTAPAPTFNEQLDKMKGQVGAALPPHIPVERFMRVVLTAVRGNADLLNADRQSLFEACMKAAQDGLLPDSREGALVIFGKKVQWMPMIGGILKKVRNSGELVSIAAHVVYENDHFEYVLGDEERIEHRPAMSDRGKPVLVYAIAKTKDGGIYREVMTVDEVEKVRSVSRAKNSGPWSNWWGEMAKKTVFRRLSKRLPMSSDLDDLIRREDELYDFGGRRSPADEFAGQAFQPVANPLSDEVPEAIEHQPCEAQVEDAETQPIEGTTDKA